MKKIFLAFLLVAMTSCTDQPSADSFPQSIVDRHDHINSLEGLKVGIVIFSDHYDHSSRQEPLFEFQEKIEKSGHKVTHIDFLRQKDFKQFKEKIEGLSKKVDAIFVFGGSGYSVDDRAFDEAAPLLDHEIFGYQHLYNFYTMERNNYPKRIDKKNLVLLTRTSAFFMKNGTILILAPGSPDGAITAIKVIADSLKHLKYQRIERQLEGNDFL